MSDLWTSPANLIAGSAGLISLFALCASAWAARTAHRALKRDEDRDFPAVTCEFQRREVWSEMSITLENASSTTWEATSMSILRPRGCRVIEKWDALEQDEGGGWRWSTNKVDQLAGAEAKLRLRVTAAGSLTSAFPGTRRGDRSTDMVHIELPRAYQGRVVAQLVLTSLEPKPRVQRVAVTRQV